MNEFARWEARFKTPDYAFGKEPNYFLESCREVLPCRGRALAVADGEGRNGVWLAQRGLDVVSLDFSPAAQKKARALAAERQVKVSFVQADVHAWIIRFRPLTLWSKFLRNSARLRNAQQNGPACDERLNPVGF